jgi:hypothetical protein
MLMDDKTTKLFHPFGYPDPVFSLVKQVFRTGKHPEFEHVRLQGVPYVLGATR